MAEKVNWIDLRRFGASLRVMPRTPLRGTLVCLDILDKAVFQRAFGWDDAAGGAEKNALRERFQRTLETLGFTSSREVSVSEGDKAPSTVFRYYAARETYSLGELRTLLPEIVRSDVKSMPAEEVVIKTVPDAAISAEWDAFAKAVLAPEGRGVWVPKKGPYDVPYAEAPSMREVETELTGRMGNRFFPSWMSRGLNYQLKEEKYRANALIAYYPTREAAMRDGHGADAVHQTDLPYALPLAVTVGDQIVAVRDVRYLADVLVTGPVHYSTERIKMVSALRAADSAQPALRAAVADVMAKTGSRECLASVNALVDAVMSSMQAVRRATEGEKASLDELSSSGSMNLSIAKAARAAEWDAVYAGPRLASGVRQFWTTVDQDLGEDLREVLDRAIESAQRFEVDRARDAAQVARQSLRAPKLARVAGDSAPPKHVDTGEKIGGARKDFHRRALSVDDLSQMNELERHTAVVKANIWPTPNYAQMRADGVEYEAAMRIKMLKDLLATAPDPAQRRDEDENVEEAYVEAIAMVRDAMASVKTTSEFDNACLRLRRAGQGGGPNSETWISGHTPIQRAWGRKAADAIFFSRLPSAQLDRIRKSLYRYTWSAERIDTTEDERWANLIRTKRVRSAEEQQEIQEKSEVQRELHRPHLDRVEREGHDWREGRDVTADDLIAHFGFRAVEFGEWLPQDERQAVLNMAYDSFADLAVALDLPPQSLSLGGDLALGFGSRGRGGRHAALAHFEPARFVINLTRMAGAGSLAHEWMHAYDWMQGDRKAFASEISEKHFKEGEAMGRLVDRMRMRHSTAEELLDRSKGNVATATSNIDSWMHLETMEHREYLASALRKTVEQERHTLLARTREDLPKAASLPGYAERGFSSRGLLSEGYLASAVDAIMETLRRACENHGAFRKNEKKIEGNAVYLCQHLARQSLLDVAAELNLALPKTFFGGGHKVKSSFLQHAERLDKLRSEPYWATTRELFARAGAAFVQDRLEKAGHRSDYLVYGADAARHETNPHGNPNPNRDDRAAMEPHFNAVFDEYRLQCVAQVEPPELEMAS